MLKWKIGFSNNTVALWIMQHYTLLRFIFNTPLFPGKKTKIVYNYNIVLFYIFYILTKEIEKKKCNLGPPQNDIHVNICTLSF